MSFIVARRQPERASGGQSPPFISDFPCQYEIEDVETVIRGIKLRGLTTVDVRANRGLGEVTAVQLLQHDLAQMCHRESPPLRHTLAQLSRGSPHARECVRRASDFVQVGFWNVILGRLKAESLPKSGEAEIELHLMNPIRPRSKSSR
jgi:hypothetical protein